MANLLAILATVGGVATSLGFGAAQIGSGLSRVTGLPSGQGMQFLIIAAATLLFLISVSTGIDRGIKWLSNITLAIAVTLLVAVLGLGPTTFILDGFTNALGSYLNRLPSMSLQLSPYSESTWTADWTIFYWAWWISWSPFVGSFIAQISRGRTIREFVGGVLLVPALVGWVWFATLGGATLHQELFEGARISAEAQGQSELVLFAMLEGLPFTGTLSWLAIVLLLIFFITSADSATSVLSQMASEGRGNVRLPVKLLWGLLISSIAIVLMLSGGLEGLQTGAILSALPFAVVLCAVVVSLIRVLETDTSEGGHKPRPPAD